MNNLAESDGTCNTQSGLNEVQEQNLGNVNVVCKAEAFYSAVTEGTSHDVYLGDVKHKPETDLVNEEKPGFEDDSELEEAHKLQEEGASLATAPPFVKVEAADTENLSTKSKPHKCSLCGKSFARAQLLRFHEQLHAAMAAAKYQLCDKTFARQRGLEQLVLVHLQLQPYEYTVSNRRCRVKLKCTTCDATFTQDFILKRHERKFKCQYCGVAFRKAEKLREHLMKVAYLLECETCRGKFCSKNSLKKHQCTSNGEINGKSDDKTEESGEKSIQEVVVKYERSIKDEVDENLILVE